MIHELAEYSFDVLVADGLDRLKGGYQDQEDALVKSMLSFDSDSDESQCEQTLLLSEPSVNLPDTPGKSTLQVKLPFLSYCVHSMTWTLSAGEAGLLHDCPALRKSGCQVGCTVSDKSIGHKPLSAGRPYFVLPIA